MEFLFTAQLQMHKNDVKCYGYESKCSALHESYENLSKDGRESMYTIQVNNYLLQHEVSDSLPADAGCHLIKLKEGHVAIDFVIIERLAGKGAEKLFLVQVSTTKYQKRSGPKLKDVYNPHITLNDKSPLIFYSEKEKIDPSQCYFVQMFPQVKTLVKRSVKKLKCIFCIYVTICTAIFILKKMRIPTRTFDYRAFSSRVSPFTFSVVFPSNRLKGRNYRSKVSLHRRLHKLIEISSVDLFCLCVSTSKNIPSKS